MEVFWCRTDPWLASPKIVRAFCAQAGIPTGDFFRESDLVPHAAGRYLLRQGFLRNRPGRPLPPLIQAPDGKLRFSGGQPAFNISHAGSVAVCAFAAAEVGVDVEGVEPLDPSLLRILHPEELAYLRRFPEEQQAPVFYQLWTQKESLVKARGGVLADVFRQESLITREGQWKESLDGFLLRKVPFPEAGYTLAVSTRDASPIRLTRLDLPTQLPEVRHLDRG